MPELTFNVAAAEPAFKGIAPLMQFVLQVENASEDRIQSIILESQIRIEPLKRRYDEAEKERLVELFGRPERWGQTVHSMFWAHAGATIPAFEARTTVRLSVPVTYDLNVAAAKYFYGLEDGDVPLIFLFSGTVFYTDPSGRLMMQRVSWENESEYRMPIGQWKDLMDHHFPNASWLYLQRDVFDELYAFRRRRGHPTWDAAVSHLLETAREEAAP